MATHSLDQVGNLNVSTLKEFMMKKFMTILIAILSLTACTPPQSAELNEDNPELSGKDMAVIRYATVLSLYEFLSRQDDPDLRALLGDDDDFVVKFVSNQDNYDELDELVLFYRESELDHEGYEASLDGLLGFDFEIGDYRYSIHAERKGLSSPFQMRLSSVYDEGRDHMLDVDRSVFTVVDVASGYALYSQQGAELLGQGGYSSIPEAFTTPPFDANRQIRWKLRRGRLAEAANGTLTVLAAGSLVSAISNSRLSGNTRGILTTIGIVSAIISANVYSLTPSGALEARGWENYTIKDSKTGEKVNISFNDILWRLKQTAPSLEGQSYSSLVAEDGKTMKNPFVETYLLHLEDLLGPLGYMRGDLFIRRYRNADFVNALIYVVTNYKDIENPVEYHNSEYRYYDELAALLDQLKTRTKFNNDELFEPSW